jgi:hypothetical protein
MSENVSNHRSKGEVKTRSNFTPVQVQHYFVQTAALLEDLKRLLPDYYGDFQAIDSEPRQEMASAGDGRPGAMHFSRAQTEGLVRDIDQIFEIRANTELAQPAAVSARSVFVSHGRSNDWRAVQASHREGRVPSDSGVGSGTKLGTHNY